MTIPTISTLPTAPARTDPPATFVTRADSFLAALVVMQGELNTSIGAMNTDIAGVNADATAAADSAAAAIASANFKGNWSDLTGALDIPAAVAHSGGVWVLLTDLADVTASEPSGANTDWQNLPVIPNQSGESGKFLTTDGSETSWVDVQTDPTLGTLSQTFSLSQTATITLSSAITAGVPIVSATKEIPQVGVTNNTWDAAAGSYDLEDTAYATTLTPSSTGDGTFTLGSGSFVSSDVGKTITGNGGVAILTSTGGAYITSTDFNDTSAIASGEWSMTALVYDSVNDVLKLSGIAEGFFDLSNASYSQNFSINAQDSEPAGIAFNNDGTKMFVTGRTGDDVNEYTLSIGFDVSTASYSQRFSVASQEDDPEGITFNNDGTKMFIVGGTGRDVNEYTLSTGFNVSTASYTRVFSVSAQETSPTGIAFNNDGTKMFIVGRGGRDVNEYTLSTSFNVSSASYSQNFSISAQETDPTGLAFNNDGTKMFIVGYGGDEVNEYTLSTGFNVSTASYSQNFSVGSQDSEPKGIAFNNDGTKMFITGVIGDDVIEYTINPIISIASGYQPAISSSIDSTYWIDINNLTAISADNDGEVFYCISNDDRTTWLVQNGSGTVRDIARNNAGIWEYNSNSTFGSETWVSATSNTELQALRDAMGEAQNQMTATTLNALTDVQQIALTNDLIFAAIFNLSSGSTVPTYSGTTINYDANLLNKGAVLGTDYDFDFPATDKVRITAINAGNYKVRIV